MDWFLYDNGLRHERVKNVLINTVFVLISLTIILRVLLKSFY